MRKNMQIVAVILTAAAAGCAVADEAPMKVFGEVVGSGTFVTRAPAEGEIVIDKAPFVITKPGKYIVTKDLVADASVIALESGDVTIDLNGHTLRYGMGVKRTTGARGIMTYTSRRKGNVGHAGILCPSRPDATEDFKGFRWNAKFANVVVRNGKVVDGTGEKLAYSHGMDLTGARGVLVENVVIEVTAPDTVALSVGPKAEVRHVTILHNGTHVTNRHAQLANIAVGPGSTVHHCWLEGGPQVGVKARNGSTVHHNLISHNGRGIHIANKSTNWNVHDNYVEVRETKNKEYKRMQTHGIKLEGTRNSKVLRNTMLAVSSDGGEPTPLNIDVKPGAGNLVADNTFIALTINKRGAYAAYFVESDLAGSWNFILQAATGVHKSVTVKVAVKPAEPFWRRRVKLALKKRIDGPVGVHFNVAKDK